MDRWSLVQLSPIFILLGCVAGCTPEPVISDALAKKKALAVATALKAPRAPAEVFYRSDQGVIVKVGELSVHLMGKNGDLRSISSRNSNLLSLTSGRALANTEDVWKAGDRVIKALGLPEYPRHEVGIRPGWSSVNRNFKFCTYKQKTGNYSSDDTGNCLTVILNSQTGSFSSLSVGAGYTYDPPKVRLSESQAISKARSQASGNRPLIQKPKLTYTIGDSMDSQAGAANFKSKRLRLAYRVILKGVTVDIDAETGEVLRVGHQRQ